jgi:hypothetical protein
VRLEDPDADDPCEATDPRLVRVPLRITDTLLMMLSTLPRRRRPYVPGSRSQSESSSGSHSLSSTCYEWYFGKQGKKRGERERTYRVPEFGVREGHVTMRAAVGFLVPVEHALEDKRKLNEYEERREKINVNEPL